MNFPSILFFYKINSHYSDIRLAFLCDYYFKLHNILFTNLYIRIYRYKLYKLYNKNKKMNKQKNIQKKKNIMFILINLKIVVINIILILFILVLLINLVNIIFIEQKK